MVIRSCAVTSMTPTHRKNCYEDANALCCLVDPTSLFVPGVQRLTRPVFKTADTVVPNSNMSKLSLTRLTLGHTINGRIDWSSDNYYEYPVLSNRHARQSLIPIGQGDRLRQRVETVPWALKILNVRASEERQKTSSTVRNRNGQLEVRRLIKRLDK